MSWTGTRGRFLAVSASALAGLLGFSERAFAVRRLLGDLVVGNETLPFAGDRPNLTTLGPTRTTALLRFSLRRSSRVGLQVLETGQGLASEQPVVPAASGTPPAAILGAGEQEAVWVPPATLPARTYILRLSAHSGGVTERSSVVARVLGVDAVFSKRSAAPGDTLSLLVATDASQLTLQMLRSGPEAEPTVTDNVMLGVPVGDPITIDWTSNTNARASIPVTVGADWPSGIYAARLDSDDGRVGFAPLIVRPTQPTARVAAVIPTYTWGAYNFYDANGDGWGDTWYARWRTRHVDLVRPNASRGVPHRYHSFDLAFQRWLALTGTVVDTYTEEDIEAIGTAEALRAAYDLVVFPGHTEYVTDLLYTIIEGYRDLGGNLMFLSANNFYRSVERRHHVLTLIGEWRNLGRPEAALCGAQYIGSDRGTIRPPYTVVGADAAPWAFAGTGLANGSTFGLYGIEFDARSPDSPPDTLVLATIPNLHGGDRAAEMTYYEHESGARVFSAGTLDFGGKIFLWWNARTLFENVWQRLI